MMMTKYFVRNNVKKVAFVLFVLLLSARLQAKPDLTVEALGGRWLIVQSGDINPVEEGLGEDYWIFQDGTITIESSGKALASDPFIVEGNRIIYGKKQYTVEIIVKLITPSKLVVETWGFIQVLEKVKYNKLLKVDAKSYV